jgi:hypothetical protein
MCPTGNYLVFGAHRRLNIKNPHPNTMFVYATSYLSITWFESMDFEILRWDW